MVHILVLHLKTPQRNQEIKLLTLGLIKQNETLLNIFDYMISMITETIQMWIIVTFCKMKLYTSLQLILLWILSSEEQGHWLDAFDSIGWLDSKVKLIFFIGVF